jgi:hypothetical protein
MLGLAFECRSECSPGEDLVVAPRDHSVVEALRMLAEVAAQQGMTEVRMAEAGEDNHHKEVELDMQD